MNNIKQILNDPELSKELDKAYELAAPYRAKVQYNLSVISQCDFRKMYDTGWILFHSNALNKDEVLICAGCPEWLQSPSNLLGAFEYIDNLLV